MSRTAITSTSQNVGVDNGGTLFSFVLGEQLTFAVTLSFLTSLNGYTTEAVVMEALNVADDPSIPKAVRPNGVNTTLAVYIPPERGNWGAGGSYSKDDVVYYNNKYYKLKSGTNRISSTTPDVDTLYWEEYTPNKIFLRFPMTMGSTWAVKPTPETPVHGYFELRVTEPSGTPFPQTWKPLRGVVELLFSPTDLVN